MAEYYGTVQGHRGIASRCGSKNSGIRAMVKSWTNTADISLSEDNGEDLLIITKPNKLKTIINGQEYKGLESNTDKIESKHNELKKILIDYECEEFGDCIIDDICKLFNYPNTNMRSGINGINK